MPVAFMNITEAHTIQWIDLASEDCGYYVYLSHLGRFKKLSSRNLNSIIRFVAVNDV